LTDGISLSQFVKSLDISKDSVIKAIKSLGEKKLITITRQKNKNGGQSFNRYSISKKLINSSNEDEETVVGENDRGSLPERQGVVGENDRGSLPERQTKETRQKKLEQKKKELLSQPKDKELSRKEQELIKPDGVDDEIWRCFLNNRKKKKSPATVLAFSKLMKKLEECKESNVAIPDLIEMAAGKGWAGLNHSWYLNEIKNNTPSVNQATGGDSWI